MTAREILDIYISFFEKRGHKKIENSSLVPKDDPTTLFTSSGMQPIVNYLLGEPHPEGKRLVNVQNCFRAQDIDEVGDNRHTTFFRMLGNWSLGDYFKGEQIPWFWEFLVDELKLDPNRLYVSVFEGYENIERDEESASIWRELFEKAGVNSEDRIFYCGVEDNWWSRSGLPDQMPEGEPGGPDTEVYFDFHPERGELKGSWLENVQSGRLMEIGNSVFMTCQKKGNSFVHLKQKNVDFGGGLERLLAAVEQKEDIFQTSLFWPIIQSVERAAKVQYSSNKEVIRLITDHLISSSFIIASGIRPSNRDSGYVLRRLIRRAFDAWSKFGGMDFRDVLHAIAERYSETDPYLMEEKFQEIVLVVDEEISKYYGALIEAKKFIQKKYSVGDELKGTIEISAEDAFNLYSSHGLSPTQLRSLGLNFDEQELASKIKEHRDLSRKAGEKKFKKL